MAVGVFGLLLGRVTLRGSDTTGEGVEGDSKDWVTGSGVENGLFTLLGVTSAGFLALFIADL